MSFDQIVATVTAVATMLTAIIAWAAIFSQRKQQLTSLQANILRDFILEFSNKEHMRETRELASQFALQRLAGRTQNEPTPAAVFHLIDFFDNLAVYYNKGTLDREMAFSGLYYWISHYWATYKSDITAFEANTGLKTYANIARMVDDLDKIGRKLKRISPAFTFSPDRLRQFFEDEISECARRNKHVE